MLFSAIRQILAYTNSVLFYLKIAWLKIKYLLFPFYGDYYFSNIGFIYFKLGNDFKSILSFEKFQSLQSTFNSELSKFNWFYLGYSYSNLGHFKNSNKYFENLLRFDKSIADIYIQTGSNYQYLFNYEKAIEYFEQAQKLESLSDELKIQFSELLFRSSKIREAVRLLKEMRNTHNDPIVKKLYSALIYKFQGDTETSIDLLKEIIEIIENNNEVITKLPNINFYYLIAKFYNDLGSFIDAKTSFEKVLKYSPYDLWACNDLAGLLLKTNTSMEKSSDLIERALKYQPFNSFFIDTKAQLLLKKGI